MSTQTDVQKLIQGLGPSSVNNGNPNTAYNQPRLSSPPPVIGADGQWMLNTINPAANLQPQQFSWTPWAAPANSLKPNMPVWPAFQQPPAPTPTGGTTPTPPAPTPTQQPPITGGGVTGGGYEGGGGSSFTSDGGGCVCIDQEIFGFVSPEAIEVGDVMPTVNPHTFEMEEHEVSYSETKTQPCIEIITDSGAKLACSMSAPLLGENGIPVLAGELASGDMIAVQINGMFDYSMVEAIVALGDQKVQHITCGNQYFLAGCGNGKYILHHNIKRGPDGQDLYGLMDSIRGLAEGGNVYGGGVQGTANTRGAMQENGSWYNIPGMGPNPNAGSSSGWDGSLVDPQYSGEAAPSAPGTNAANPWETVGGMGNFDSSWMKTGMPDGTGSYQDILNGLASLPYSAANNAAAAPPAPAAPQPQSHGIKDWLSKAADWLLPGNQYHSDTQEWAPSSSIITSAVDMLGGLKGLGSKTYDMYGQTQLKDGYNPQSSVERATLGRLQYDYQRGTPEQRQQAINNMRSGGLPDSVINEVTGGGSAWKP